MENIINYHTDEISENQRRTKAIGSFESLDAQYSKKHLSDRDDPSPWVDSDWKTCHPASYQPKEVCFMLFIIVCMDTQPVVELLLHIFIT